MIAENRSGLYYFLREFYILVVKYPIARMLFLFNFKNKENHYIIIPSHVGDELFALGYLYAYKQKHNIKHVTLVIPRKTLIDSYYQDDYDEIILKSTTFINFSTALTATNSGTHFLKKQRNITIIHPADSFTEEYFDYPSKFPESNLQSLIKYGDYELSKNDGFKNRVVTYQNQNKNEKKALVCLQAQSLRLNTMTVIEYLAKHLEEKGFRLYVNSTENKRMNSLNNPIYLSNDSIDEVLKVASECSVIIGIRNGVMDFASFLNTAIIAIYPEDSGYMKFYSLENNPNVSAEILEIKETLHSDEDKNEILNWLDKRLS